MHQAVNYLAVHKSATSDSCAHGDIDSIGQFARRSPFGFAEQRDVSIGLEIHRNIQPSLDRAKKIVVLPTRLRRGSDVTESRRGGVQVHGSKRADANGKNISSGLASEEFEHGCESNVWGGGWELSRFKFVRACSDAAVDFCAACLDASKHSLSICGL
jgi:hypothetical protein